MKPKHAARYDNAKYEKICYTVSMNETKIWRVLFLTLFVFGLLGWVYIVLNSEFHPWTLPMQLTHFAPWPREDTFGELCFAVSFVSFFAWNMLRKEK